MNNALEKSPQNTGEPALNETRATSQAPESDMTNEVDTVQKNESARGLHSEPVDAPNAPEPEAYETGAHRLNVDTLELSALGWRRFAGMGANEVVELVAISKSGGVQTAYAKGETEYLRLARAGDGLGAAGVFQVANSLSSRVRPLCKTGSWSHRIRRAEDSWIAERRVLGIDIDPVRPSGVSATEDEWRACAEVAEHIKRYLCKYVPASSLGTGGSGNGVWIFVALQLVTKDPAHSERIKAFLKALDKRFGKDGRVKIDSTVGNPARIVPLWGTWKRKGPDTPERPHRETTFCCAGTVERAPLAALIG